MIENPPWADRLLKEHWDYILAEVKDPAWMPSRYQPVQGPPHLETFLGQTVLRPADPHGKRRHAELGCGHYGCVYATGAPGIVCKITTDPSEVAFIRAATDLKDWPEGIVKYKAVLDLPGGSHRGRGAWILWREEAFDVGGHPSPRGEPYESRVFREFDTYLIDFKVVAGTWVRDTLKRSKTPKKLLDEAKALEDWAWQNVDYNETGWKQKSVWRGAYKIAAGLKICLTVAQLMGSTSYAYLVGETLEFYLRRDILLCDVHLNNIGSVTRPEYSGPVKVIPDPGHALFLNDQASKELP